ncbi:MAG: energy transducer TonB [Caulobacterales bacterium]|nr:energy transducer TonB [Caulobacterales bacterium]
MIGWFALICGVALSVPPAAPDWMVRPQPQFPHGAYVAGVTEGSVQLRCDAASDGVLSSCVVLSEQPEGVGFARAALDSLAQARLTPIPPGEPRPQAMFTMRFVLEADQAPPGESDVTLNCELLQDGSVRDCRIVHERPEVQGMGAWLIAHPEHLHTDTQPDWRSGERTTISIYPARPGS